MRSLIVIELSPGFNDDPGFSSRDEPFTIQTFVPQLAVEALHKAAARLDISGADILVSQPLHHGSGREFRSIVRADVGGFPIQPHQP